MHGYVTMSHLQHTHRPQDGKDAMTYHHTHTTAVTDTNTCHTASEEMLKVIPALDSREILTLAKFQTSEHKHSF